MSVAPPFEAGRNYFKSPMQSLNKTLFPSNGRENPTRFSPAVQIIGYQKARPSVAVVVPRAFPNSLNTWHHNFFPAGTSSTQDIPMLPTQTNRTCQTDKETQPRGNVAENAIASVSELFLLLCQVQYILFSCIS